MKKVAFCTKGRTPQQSLEGFLPYTSNYSGIWKNIKGVNTLKEADYAIVWSDDVRINFDTKRIIQFRREPDRVRQFKPIPSVGYLIDYHTHFNSAIWIIEKSFNDLVNSPYIPGTHKASVICSIRWPHRNKFLRKVVNSSAGKDIHFYGRGLHTIVGTPEQNPNSKGILPDPGFKYNRNCKLKGLEKYDYSIAMENSSQVNYFTEKINDCFVAWTMPLYWGCPNISQFFPEDSYHLIDLKRPEDIKEMIEQPLTLRQIEAVREARNLVLHRYNPWEIISQVLT